MPATRTPYNDPLFRFIEDLGLAITDPDKTSLPVNITADPTAYTLTADVPGLTSADVHAEATYNDHGDAIVSISGTRKPPAPSPNYLRSERTYGPFKRTFSFDSANISAITAKVENGVLTVSIPLASPSKPSSVKIPVA